MRRTSAAVVSALLLGLAAPAAARPFGAKGQYIVTSDAKADLFRTTTEVEGQNDVTATQYAFRLAGDYTRFENVTFGMQAGFEGTVVGDDAEKGFRLGARAGYVVPLGGGTSLWARFGFSYGNTTYQSATDQFTVSSLRMTASVPLIFNPYPQIIVGLSPSYERDLSAKSGINDDSPVPRRAGFGVNLILGFWFE